MMQSFSWLHLGHKAEVPAVDRPYRQLHISQLVHSSQEGTIPSETQSYVAIGRLATRPHLRITLRDARLLQCLPERCLYVKVYTMLCESRQ